MTARLAITSLPVPPYTWIPEGLRKGVPVFTATGPSTVHRMTPEGNIRIGNKASKKKGVHQNFFAAPKRMGFAKCPSCQTLHASLTRRCTECGESLVYYPQLTDTNRKKFIIGHGDAVQANPTAKVRVGEAPEHRKKLQAVRSSLSHFLFTAFEFETAAALIQAEIDIRASLGLGRPGEKMVQRSVQRVLRKIHHARDFVSPLPTYNLKLKKDLEMSDRAVWFTYAAPAG